ncbi:hypothetical protein HPB51_024491 [Rhipicephalus microplus]|uniref:Transglutaminase-like domain-containing protein n=1 Tax=Rhipicephalus microplus TaxID=6941 RepID=A0A9J6DDE9_RHIMP|nr:hypothetical protein HPB51_024491 [Rhipicephalus microplus]
MDTSDEAILDMLRQRMLANSNFLQYMEIVIESLRSGAEFDRMPRLMAHTGGTNPLQVKQLDYHIPANTRHHKTDKFLLTQSSDATLVVRRGAPVTISIQFDRQYDGSRDQVFLILNTGLDPSESDGSRVRLEVPCTRGSFFSLDNSPYSICLVLTEKNSVTVKVMLPPCAAVGLWHLEVETRLRGSGDPADKCLFNVKETFYVLFNPWCPEDLVYMPQEDLLKEYIFNETGKLYQGNYDYPTGKRWFFGQFTDVVLPTCNYLFELGNVSVSDRSSPIKVARALSALVDSKDENGILVGSWDNNYGDGVSPTAWTSSVTILEQYMHTGGAPVKYGQCWVYSGLELPPVERAMDDASRPSWRLRWLAGLFRVGPCPVSAIYNGHLELDYDTRFVYAEVNADLVSWKRDRATGQFRQSTVRNYNEAEAAGMLIYTKKIGEMTEHTAEDAEDLTKLYKGVKVKPNKSVMGLSGAPPPEDVEMKMEEISSVLAGQPVRLAVTCTNQSKTPRKVTLTLSAHSVFYTGGEYKLLKKQSFNVEVPPGKTETVCLTVTADEYQLKLAPQNVVKLFAHGSYEGSGHGTWYRQTRITIGNPTIDVQIHGPVSVSRPMEYCLSFDNPLSVPLTGCSLTLDIPGMQQSHVVPVADVPAKGKFEYKSRIIPKRPGEKSILAVFNSKELTDIRGNKVVIVK